MLLSQLATAADTIVVRQVPPIRTTFEQVAFVASGLTSILALVLVVVAIVALLTLRRKADEMKVKVDEILVELRPLARNASAMYSDVREVAQDIKEMVEESRETVKSTNERVRKSVGTLTHRVDQLSSMIARVHDSAEAVAGVATTALGGLKLGARAVGMGKRKKKSVPPTERPRLRRKD